jgi:WD40 repeat protein
MHNIKLNKQKHLTGHEEDIISFAVDKNKEYMASGETTTESNQRPVLNVWKRNGDLFHCFKNFSDRGINSIAFSPNNTYLIAVTVDDNHTIHLFDLIRKKLISSTPGGASKILDICFKSDTEFATVGIKHFSYWNISNDTIIGEEGLFRETDNKIGLVIYHDNYFITGSSTGEIALWENSTLYIYKKIHQKNVDTLHAHGD